MRPSVFISLAFLVGIVLFVNIFFDEPQFKSLSDKAIFEQRANQFEAAEKTLLQIVLGDSSNIENHVQYIKTHFQIPVRKKIGRKTYEYRDDETILNFYNSLSHSPDSRIADIGFYGKGLIRVHLEIYPEAITEFLKVNNKNLKYLNNSLGNAYYQVDSAALAELYFRKEIESNGNFRGAYSNLFNLFFEKGRFAELKVYLKNPETKKYFPPKVERSIYFSSFQPVNYVIHLLNRTLLSINSHGAIAALLILFCWVIYLRKLDIFESEKWIYIVSTLVLGMLFSFLTYPLSDFDNLFFNFKLNGEYINDFFYCIIGIGAVEELVKIIPLLLMMRFSGAINEPFDYIKYASLSALGFAFIENLLYFQESNLHIIHGRALTAVVSHMFDSSIIAYGIILNKYKRRKNPYLNFIFFFVLAAFAHGFYDFWLINKSASAFSIVTLIFLLVSINMWNSFKNNALNHSNFFDKEKSIDNDKLQDYLFYSLAAILMFEYIAIASKFSPGVANISLVSSVYSGTFLLFFLSGNLSKFSITQGQWAPIRYWGAEGKINYEKAVGSEFKLFRFTSDEHAYQFLPNSGKIFKRLTVSKEPDWYLIKLYEPKQHSNFVPDTVLVRTKNKDERLERGKKTFIAFYIIPMETNLEKDKLKRTDFKFCGWATTG